MAGLSNCKKSKLQFTVSVLLMQFLEKLASRKHGVEGHPSGQPSIYVNVVVCDDWTSLLVSVSVFVKVSQKNFKY